MSGVDRLSMTEFHVYYLLLLGQSKSGGDVDIDELHAANYSDEPMAYVKQQRVGAIVSRINKKLAKDGVSVKPGERKRTYRLVYA